MVQRARGYAKAATILALFIACTAPLPRPRYAAQSTTSLVETPFPPPPARAEFVPKQPARDAVWIDGEWTWRGHRWGWNPGRWVIPPAGASFSPWTTVRSADGTLFFAQGVWRDAHGDIVAAPPPLALGTTGPTAEPAEGPATPHEPSSSAEPEPAPLPSSDGGS
jgi:hypothetical protein